MKKYKKYKTIVLSTVQTVWPVSYVTKCTKLHAWPTPPNKRIQHKIDTNIKINNNNKKKNAT